MLIRTIYTYIKLYANVFFLYERQVSQHANTNELNDLKTLKLSSREFYYDIFHVYSMGCSLPVYACTSRQNLVNLY